MDWDQYYINMLDAVAVKSKDQSKKVGCIIVGPDNEIRTTGYNNFPRGIKDDIPERHERPAKYLYTEHAERNAIYNAARMGTALLGCRAYISWFPCSPCARALINSGIESIIVDYRDSNPWKKPSPSKSKWDDDIQCALEMLGEAYNGKSVKVIKYDRV
jgi:dCMP deaminase